MAGFAVNQVLFDELQAADETLKTSEISTPRDDTILKAMKNKMQTEIVRGLTVVSFVDTVEEANVSIMAASIAVTSSLLCTHVALCSLGERLRSWSSVESKRTVWM